MSQHWEILRCIMKSRKYRDITTTGDLLVAKKPVAGEIVVAKATCYEKMTVGVMTNDVIAWMREHNVRHYIIVCSNGETSRARMTAGSHGVRVEIFSPKELIFDITRHVLQPEFENLGSDNTGDYKDYGSLLVTDPISKWYDYQLNDVIKITKKSGAIYYRVVRSIAR